MIPTHTPYAATRHFDVFASTTLIDQRHAATIVGVGRLGSRHRAARLRRRFDPNP